MIDLACPHHTAAISTKGDSYRLKFRDLGRVPVAAFDEPRPAGVQYTAAAAWGQFLADDRGSKPQPPLPSERATTVACAGVRANGEQAVADLDDPSVQAQLGVT